MCRLTKGGPDGAMHDAVPAIAALGVSPIVRLADLQGWMVKRTFYITNSQPNAHSPRQPCFLPRRSGIEGSVFGSSDMAPLPNT